MLAINNVVIVILDSGFVLLFCPLKSKMTQASTVLFFSVSAASLQSLLFSF